MKRFETSHGTLRKWSDSGLRPSGGHPRPTSKLQKTFFKTPLKLQAFFEWRPDRCTHFPRPLRVASRRLRMQKSVFSKMLVPLRNIEVFAGRVALRPPPRAIWTDVRSCYPWETPPPHPTKNKKKRRKHQLGVFEPWRGTEPFASPPRPRTRLGPHEAQRPLGTSFGTSCGLIWGPLAASLGLSSLFSFLYSVFSPLSSLFSLFSALFPLPS